MRGSFIDMRVEGGIKGRVESWEKKRMHESGGERQDDKAVGSNGSSIEASAPTFGGQGLDKLSRPYGKLRVKWDGQESRLRIVFERNQDPSWPWPWPWPSPHVTGGPPQLGIGYGVMGPPHSMGMWDYFRFLFCF